VTIDRSYVYEEAQSAAVESGAAAAPAGRRLERRRERRAGEAAGTAAREAGGGEARELAPAGGLLLELGALSGGTARRARAVGLLEDDLPQLAAGAVARGDADDGVGAEAGVDGRRALQVGRRRRAEPLIGAVAGRRDGELVREVGDAAVAVEVALHGDDGLRRRACALEVLVRAGGAAARARAGPKQGRRRAPTCGASGRARGERQHGERGCRAHLSLSAERRGQRDGGSVCVELEHRWRGGGGGAIDVGDGSPGSY
jgi:hypothetical protein